GFWPGRRRRTRNRRSPASLHTRGNASCIVLPNRDVGVYYLDDGADETDCGARRRSTGAEYFAEQIDRRIAVAEMLAKALGKGDARFLAAPGAPVAHGVDVVIDAVVLQQPFSLAGVRRQHGDFRLEHAADIHAKRWSDIAAERILALDRIAIVQVRDVFEAL